MIVAALVAIAARSSAHVVVTVALPGALWVRWLAAAAAATHWQLPKGFYSNPSNSIRNVHEKTNPQLLLPPSPDSQTTLQPPARKYYENRNRTCNKSEKTTAWNQEHAAVIAEPDGKENVGARVGGTVYLQGQCRGRRWGPLPLERLCRRFKATQGAVLTHEDWNWAAERGDSPQCDPRNSKGDGVGAPPTRDRLAPPSPCSTAVLPSASLQWVGVEGLALVALPVVEVDSPVWFSLPHRPVFKAPAFMQKWKIKLPFLTPTGRVVYPIE